MVFALTSSIHRQLENAIAVVDIVVRAYVEKFGVHRRSPSTSDVVDDDAFRRQFRVSRYQLADDRVHARLRGVATPSRLAA